MNGANIMTIDDRDPSIQYFELNGTGIPWSEAGTPDEYNGTTTFSNQEFAAMRVTFFGTGITVFGTWDTNPPTPVFVLDGSAPQSPQSPVADPGPHHQFPFYQSPAGVPAGNHSLLMVLVQSGTIWIDSMNITSDGQSSATLSASPTSLTEGVATPTLLPTSTAAPASDAASRAAIIASGVLGGVLFLLLLSLAFWYMCRRFTTTKRTVSQAESQVLIPFYGNRVSGSVAGSAMHQRDESLAGTSGSHPGTVVAQPRPGKVVHQTSSAPVVNPVMSVPPGYSEYSVSG